MIFDQLLSSCSHDLRTFLLEQSFKDSLSLAEAADRYLTTHGINKCRKGRKSLSNQSVPSKTKSATDSKTDSVGNSSSSLTCHNCGEIGHIRPNCPNLKQNKKKFSDKVVPKINVVLNREEKLTNCITDRYGKLFDNKVEVVFDTGYNTVVVRDKLIPPSISLGKKTKVYDYLGRPIYLNTLDRNIDCKFFTGCVKAVIAPIKCTDVIIGLIDGHKDNVDKGLNMISNSDVKVNVVTRMQAKSADLQNPPLVHDSLTERLGLNYVDFAHHQSKCDSLAEIRKLVENETISTVSLSTGKLSTSNLAI